MLHASTDRFLHISVKSFEDFCPRLFGINLYVLTPLDTDRIYNVSLLYVVFDADVKYLLVKSVHHMSGTHDFCLLDVTSSVCTDRKDI